jgi:hypothetical protein
VSSVSLRLVSPVAAYTVVFRGKQPLLVGMSVCRLAGLL